MSKRGAELYLEDIKNSIEKIEGYVAEIDFEKFSKDEKTIDAVIRNLEIIGEAVNNLPEEIKSQNPEIPWKEAVGMRNKVAHEYFGVDDEILWKTVTEDLPIFKEQISKLL
jgi:uncharacterized protein with HEPN domain